MDIDPRAIARDASFRAFEFTRAYAGCDARTCT
jgi:hypothetical protein